MCLITKQKYPKLALRDIKVKKQVWYINGKWKTPIQMMPLDPKVSLIEPEQKPTLWQLIKGSFREDLGSGTYAYRKGFIHSDGLTRDHIDQEINGQKYKYFDAIIPAGSFYYCSDEWDEYCSTKLIIKWEID